MSRPLKILITLLSLCISSMAYTQVDTIVWQQLSPLPNPTGLDAPGYFLIDSDFYVVGGADAGNNQISRVWKYHIPTDTWVQLGNLPFGGASGGGASFVLNGKGYFLVGTDSINNDNCDTMFWEYNPSLDSWNRRAGFPDNARYNATWFSHANKGYVGFTGGCSGADNHLWEYDPILNTWAQKNSLPSAQGADRGLGQLSDPNVTSAYFIGGVSDYNGSYNGDIWSYNIFSDNWDSLGQMPGGPRMAPVFWGFDSVLIGGGGTNGNILFNDFYRYDVYRNIWTPVIFQNSFDSIGGTFGTFLFNKKAYCFGGCSSIASFTFNNKLWSFDASRFLHTDTTTKDTTGIAAVKSDLPFSLYPNPVSHEQGFSISTSESGSISFYDALGRLLDERRLSRGLTQIRLTTDDEVIFYRATLSGGMIKNGKVVFIR